jgi:hypothetical protein
MKQWIRFSADQELAMLNRSFESYDPTHIRRIVAAYGDMIQQKIDEGFEAYLLTIMFRDIRGPRNGVISRMLEETSRAYRRCVTFIVRNPRSPSQAHNLPIWLCSPDFPVAKEAKKQLRDVALNDGLHVGGIILVPPVSRLDCRLDGHFLNNQRRYTGRGSQIRTISSEPIIKTPERATDYVLKALKRGRVTMDDIWVFPPCLSELSSKKGAEAARIERISASASS